MSPAGHATFFDASALVKLYVEEPGSGEVRAYWNRQVTKYTSPFCFYETLGVLKLKTLRSVLSRDGYIEAARRLHAWFAATSSKIPDVDFTKRPAFYEAAQLAIEHELDLSDAFQLLSLRSGFFCPLVRDSATILVTADERLANSARKMGLRVWDCVREPVPEA